MKLDVVEIRWLDSSEFAGWESVEEARAHHPFIAVTVGILLRITTEFYMVVQTMGEAGVVMGNLVIPTGCIVKVTTLGSVEVEVCDGSPPEAP